MNEQVTVEDALVRISNINDSFKKLTDSNGSGHSLYSEVVVLINQLSAAIEIAESRNIEKDVVKRTISDARNVLSLSPYIKRIQTWPRGYQGDFETVELMSEGVKSGVLNTLADCLEYYAQSLPITQQHRNKLVFQERMARNVIARNGNIVSIGCGGAIDIVNALRDFPNYSGQITFIDMDDDAIQLVKERTQKFNFEFSTRNVVRGAGKLPNDHYDLALCGGLFDYLEEGVAGMLLRQLRKKISTPGCIFFTNIAEGNPFRIQMEYLCDWTLIERSDENIRDLAKALDSSSVVIERDETGLAMLAQISIEP